MKHVVLRSNVYKLGLFGRKLARKDHQLVQHVIGTDELVCEVEKRFMDECKMFVDAMNRKEARIGKVKYVCDSFLTYEKDENVEKYPITIEMPNAHPA